MGSFNTCLVVPIKGKFNGLPIVGLVDCWIMHIMT